MADSHKPAPCAAAPACGNRKVAMTTDEQVFTEAFRARLVELQERAGLSSTELAAKTGTSIAQVSRWTAGLYVPKLFWIARIARALGVEVSALVPGQPAERRTHARRKRGPARS